MGSTSDGRTLGATPRLAGLNRFFEFSLLGMVASGYLAVAGSGLLDLPTLVAVAGAILWRAFFLAGALPLRIPDRAVALITAAYILFYPADYYWFSGDFLTATVHLVFFLAIMKLLTARRRRDYFFVKVIAFLEMLAGAVVSNSPNFFLFLAFFLLFSIAAFASGEIRLSAERADATCRAGLAGFPARLATLTVIAAIGSLVLAAAMFFVLPRTARAAFQRLAASGFTTPGFSHEVALGKTGEFRTSNAPVMHIRIEDCSSQANFKWRGAALGEFDGKRWYNTEQSGVLLPAKGGVVWLMDNRRAWQGGKRVTYEVVIKGVSSDALFFAGSPLLVQLFSGGGVVRTSTDTFRASTPGDNLRYAAVSAVEAEGEKAPDAGDLSEDERNYYLLLPPFDPRIRQLAEQVTAGQTTAEAKARSIETYLRTSYRYTTEPPATATVTDPLADFLFRRKAGHCEYFASAMAVMLRSIWIPARLATGFQSGVYNPLSGWHTVRASDAHSWVEAWISGKGWVTFDPTPAGAAAAPVGVLERLWFYADAAETFWEEWVLNYDLDRQLILAEQMGKSGRNLRLTWFQDVSSRLLRWRNGVELFVRRFGLLLLAVGGVVWLLRLGVPPLLRRWRVRTCVAKVRRGLARTGDATLLYEKMLRQLERRGLEKPASWTPNEFARAVRPAELAALVEALTASYNRLRFGGDRQAASEMLGLLAQLEKLR